MDRRKMSELVLHKDHPLARKRRLRKWLAVLGSLGGTIWWVRFPFKWMGKATIAGVVVVVALIVAGLIAKSKKKKLDEEIEAIESRFSDAQIELGSGQLSTPEHEGEQGALSTVASKDGALSDPE